MARRRVPLICIVTFGAIVLTAPAAASRRTDGLFVVAGPVRLEVPIAEVTSWRATSSSAEARVRFWLRSRARVRARNVDVTLVFWRRAVLRVLAAARTGAPSVTLDRVVQAVQIRARPVRQSHRNNCETAALSIALGASLNQDMLQRQLPSALPIRKQERGSTLIWGDPQLGFVGDVDRGGYGVYDRPLLALARRFDPAAINLTGSPFAVVLAALREGRPVVAWVTLGTSRPTTWRTPTGRFVLADAAEHAITLVGVSRGVVSYLDPWDGMRKRATIDELAARYLPLGRHAIALAPRTAQARS